jgi:hypothetical protein
VCERDRERRRRAADGDYWSKPNRESIFAIVYDLMHEAKPGKYPRFM